MNDDEFVAMVVEIAAGVPGVEAVMLGGSRARGDHRPDSDWDFAVYYRGRLDVAYFEALGWPGTVFRPGDWGRVMYGGAQFDLEGRHFDIHYRNLDTVEHWTEEARNGRFEIDLLNFHLAGLPTYMLTGELATGVVLDGTLARPEYPDALRREAPIAWRNRARPELDYARYWVNDENPVSLAGSLAKAVVEEAHARLAERGIWALNEKRIVRAAGLDGLFPLLANVGTSQTELSLTLDEVRTQLFGGGT